MRVGPTSLLVLALGCAPAEPATVATRSHDIPPVASASAESRREAPPPARRPEPTPRDAWREGQPVVARGKISRTPWQHLMGHVPGKQSEYFDLEDGGQIVVYASELPTCPGFLLVEGTVLSVRGASKRPGAETKVDDSYEELHIDVSSARCE